MYDAVVVLSRSNPFSPFFLSAANHVKAGEADGGEQTHDLRQPDLRAPELTQTPQVDGEELEPRRWKRERQRQTRCQPQTVEKDKHPLRNYRTCLDVGSEGENLSWCAWESQFHGTVAWGALICFDSLLGLDVVVHQIWFLESLLISYRFHICSSLSWDVWPPSFLC